MEDYHTLVEGSRSAFDTGKTKNVEWRIEQIKAFDRMLVENESTFVAALKTDLNKPLQESIMTEIDFLRNDVIAILRNINTWTKDQQCESTPTSALDSAFIHPEPYGVALVIGAWNYPLQLCLAPVLPAIAAGNCVVIKPSEISQATAQAMADLIPQYLDKDCVKVVCGGVAETTELLKEKFDYIFYTGSTQVGRIIGTAAAAQLTPCTLELGGKSPTYIDASGDLELKVKRLIWGKCNNSGQICVAPDYVLCTKEVAEKMIPIIKRVMLEFYGDTPELSPDYCRIVSARHFSRLVAMLSTTKGFTAIGGASSQETRFMELTVLTGVGMDDSTMQEEIFGPILPIIAVESPEEAIKLINSRPKPLAMYIFSESKEVQAKFLNETSSGGVLFNDTLMHLTLEQLPFGGVGESGMGNYHGKFGFDTFTHYKPVMKRTLGWLGEALGGFRYPPYDEKAIKTIRNILKNRAFPNLGFLKYVVLLIIGAGIGAAVTFLIMEY